MGACGRQQPKGTEVLGTNGITHDHVRGAWTVELIAFAVRAMRYVPAEPIDEDSFPVEVHGGEEPASSFVHTLYY
jgi:hypothetical protein